MAKKMTAKEKREEQQKKKQKMIEAIQDQKRQEEQQRREEEAQRARERAEEERRRELQSIAKELEERGEDQRKKKSMAKAAGLKSTFVLNRDTLLMTSFGKGSQALLDKHIAEDEITDASAEAMLDVMKKEKAFSVSGRIVKEATADNPLASNKAPGQDVIRCRRQLEQMYFKYPKDKKCEFEDNIHIQLIYNILDIEKVLAVQVNNAVFALNNMLRREEGEYDDLIGYMGVRSRFETFRTEQPERYELFRELIRKPQMGYFGTTFVPVDDRGRVLRKDDSAGWEPFERKCYHLFTALGTLRQATAHGNEKTRSLIYRLSAGKETDSRWPVCQELNRLYRERVHTLNEEFLKMSYKDLMILKKAYDVKTDEQWKHLVREYYRFVVLKSFKNMGFSIKRLREVMIERCAGHLADQQYDTVRNKLNRSVDFSIYLYFDQEEHRSEAEELVAQLRGSADEVTKEYLYREKAKCLWEALEDVIDGHILPKMNGEYISKISTEQLDGSLIQGILVEETADPFSELMYLLTLFLDGKEINDLLTQLINRFDNISSFLEVMKQENIECTFNPDYEMFARSAQIAKELRVINSFARMSQPSPNAKKAMFIEAAQVLGFEEDEDELEAYIERMLDQKNAAPGKNKNGFRNFIINNVIESSRFKYLVRYGNPKKLRAFATNQTVVDFVLKDIPDTQITAYYNSCEGTACAYDPKMRETLAKHITDLHFRDFENVYQANTDDKEKMADKERKRNIIRLYLTVLYLLLKNLIYVNSRYFLAFHCAERDAAVCDPKRYNPDQNAYERDWMKFAQDFLEEHGGKKRSTQYLKKNMENADRWSLRTFRNCTEHLNAIRNADKYIGDCREFSSYFGLYHYLVQRTLIDQFAHDCATPSVKFPGTMIYSEAQAEGKLLTYFGLVEKHGTYCKDFVKALNVPFAYNLARYKNLSIDELFDRNHYLPSEGKLC